MAPLQPCNSLELPPQPLMVKRCRLAATPVPVSQSSAVTVPCSQFQRTAGSVVSQAFQPPSAVAALTFTPLHVCPALQEPLNRETEQQRTPPPGVLVLRKGSTTHKLSTIHPTQLIWLGTAAGPGFLQAVAPLSLGQHVPTRIHCNLIPGGSRAGPGELGEGAGLSHGEGTVWRRPVSSQPAPWPEHSRPQG